MTITFLTRKIARLLSRDHIHLSPVSALLKQSGDSHLREVKVASRRFNFSSPPPRYLEENIETALFL
jgi:hypothetical protein